MTEQGKFFPVSEILCNLERVFGINDLAFREYMNTKSTGKVSSNELVELSSAMATHEHPLVQYAAGWAVAEAALFRNKTFIPTKDTPETRLQLLAQAKQLWLTANENFAHMRNRDDFDQTKREDFLWFELQSLQALSFEPAMQIACFWFSGYGNYAEGDYAEDMLQQTKSRLMTLGIQSFTLNLPYKRKVGLCNEIVSSLLLQANHSDYLIIPASLRQDRHRRNFLRADLLAITNGEDYKKTLIQVSSTHNPAIKEEMRFMIYPWRDLKLASSKNSQDTLVALMKREKGESTPEENTLLDELSSSLRDRLLAFKNKNTPNS